MKKVFLILTVFSFVITSSVFCQKHITEVPQAIKDLGGNYSEYYLEMANNIIDQEKNLLSHSQAYPNVEALFFEQGKIFGFDKATDYPEMTNNLNEIFKNGIKGLDNISVNNIDKNLFELLKNFVSGIEKLGSKEELDGYQIQFVNEIKNAGLSEEQLATASLFLTSMNATLEPIVLNFSNEQGKWSLWGAIKCAAGTVGGAVLGGIAGAAVGTVTLPVIGTVSGTAVGFYGGALTGMAASCGS